jgi:hypothetical protein
MVGITIKNGRHIEVQSLYSAGRVQTQTPAMAGFNEGANFWRKCLATLM